MTKILIFSDCHFTNWQYGSSIINGWNSRLLDQKKVADQIVSLADKYKCDIAIHCGDLFHVHGRVEAEPLKVASDLFKQLKDICSKVFCIVGNHDMGQGTNSVSWLKNLGVNVVENYLIDYENRLGFVAYCSEREALIQRLNILKEYNLKYWFLHQGLSGSPVGSDFVIPNEIFFNSDLPKPESGFEHCFTGHYHAHKSSTRLSIIGSPMQFTWGDKNNINGCIILDTKRLQQTFHQLNAPKFIEINNLSLGSPANLENNFIRLTEEIPSYHMEDIRKKFMSSGARSVEFTYRKPLPTTGLSDNNFNMSSLLKKYIEINKVPKEGVDILNEITGIRS